MAQTSRGGVNVRAADGAALDSGRGRRKNEKRRRDQFRLAEWVGTGLRQAGHDRAVALVPGFGWA